MTSNSETALRSTRIETPIGALLAVVDAEDRLVRLEFLGVVAREDVEERLSERGREVVHDDGAARDVARQLAEYFAGERRTFDLALAPEGTEFQLASWEALRDIPWGATRTYAEQAEAIGRPTAVRAVGRANGANPIPIVVPCHRVIGADGSLTGFGGGLPVKRALLELEGVLLPVPRPATG